MEEIPKTTGKLNFFNSNLKCNFSFKFTSIESELKVSYVEQEPFIFPDTIKNNILFGEKFDSELYV
jgi:ABC-type transport system involved in cytochrome bd biosynthesis fused ATPase/permease subunit